MEKKALALKQIYNTLFKAFGCQHWWPGETQIEIIVGAILTQNTNWKNVEKAIANLKDGKLLSLEALRKISTKELASLIKPTGYFNIKAKRLKNFIDFIYLEYDGDLKKMESQELFLLREKLLSVNGIGPETADSILLYAFNKHIFVIDAYTKRILIRHNLAKPDDEYSVLQKKFMNNLDSDTKMFNEYHALLVHTGKHFCKTTAPLCTKCPLGPLLPSCKPLCPG